MFSEGRRGLSKAGSTNNVNDSKFQLGVCCFQFLGLFSISQTSA